MSIRQVLKTNQLVHSSLRQVFKNNVKVGLYISKTYCFIDMRGPRVLFYWIKDKPRTICEMDKIFF
jgi:hypothetical protein